MQALTYLALAEDRMAELRCEAASQRRAANVVRGRPTIIGAWLRRRRDPAAAAAGRR